MLTRRASRKHRPLSSAASFFRKNGSSDKSTPQQEAPPVRATRPTKLLDCSPEERELLSSSILPKIVEYLSINGLQSPSLFLKDPSQETQEAMLGIAQGQREPVRALRELLDSRFENNEEVVFAAHDVYIWGVSLKIALRELSKPIVPKQGVFVLIEAKDFDSVNRKAEYLRDRFVVYCPQVVSDLFLLLQACQTESDKLGYMFSALLFLNLHGVEDGDGNQITSNAEAISESTKFLVANADLVFGSEDNKMTKSSSSKPPPPPPMRPNMITQFNDPEIIQSPPRILQQQSIESSGRALFKAICVYDFDPDEPDELELRVGDEISVFEMGEDDWWKGQLQLPDGVIEEGVFPSTYVKRLDIDSPQQPIQQTQNYEDQEEYDEFSSQAFSSAPPPPPPPVVAPVVSKPPAPPPPPVVAVAPPPPPSKSATTMNTNTAEEVLATVLYDFEPEEAGELALTKGETITILDRSDTEWWLGCREDGVKGLFPHNYAKLIEGMTNGSKSQAPPPPSQASKSGEQTTSKARPGLERVASARPRPPPPPGPAVVIDPKVLGINLKQGSSTNLLNKPTAPLPPMPIQHRSEAPPPPMQNRTIAPPPPSVTPIIVQQQQQDISAEDPAKRGWIVTGEMFQKYCIFFDTLPKDQFGRAGGRDVANFLVQSGLPQKSIAQILEISDMDGDKNFDRDEFAIATHLSLCISKRGMPIPIKLPPYMIPKSKRHLVS